MTNTNPDGWVVRWRMPSPAWSAKMLDSGIYDYAGVWDEIPWSPELTEALHKGEGAEAAARDQFHTLYEWARTHAQPVKDVELLHLTISPIVA